MENRTVTELSKMTGRVYVNLPDAETERKFMEDAEAEGFTFCDGVKPTQRQAGNIMAINHDMTINFVGAAGRMAFGAKAKNVNGEKLIRVDYKKYSAGDADYHM